MNDLRVDQFANEIWALVPDVVWTGSERLTNVSIVIRGEKIIKLASGASLGEIPRVFLSGCTIIPGLIDAHVHLSEWMLPGFLAAGVTTVRDVGNDLEWILSQRKFNSEDPLRGPTIFCCGPVLDGVTVNWSGISISHVDEFEVATSVRKLVSAGVDAIKLYVNLTDSQISAAIKAAGETGAFVLAHLGEVNSQRAAALGVNEIEHLSGCIHHEHGGSTPYTDSTYLERCVDIFLDHGTVMCPTLIVWDRLSHINEVAFANDRRLEWVHPLLLEAWNNFPHRFIDPGLRLDRQQSLVTMKKSLYRIWARGVQIIAGTDTPWPFVIPGFSIHDELALAVDSGITPVEALKMATINPAKVLGQSGKIGEIAVGATADLLAVRGDPTIDIHDLSNVCSVVHRGMIVDRGANVRTREKLFRNVPTDPVTELITSVSDNRVVPISPEVKFDCE